MGSGNLTWGFGEPALGARPHRRLPLSFWVLFPSLTVGQPEIEGVSGGEEHATSPFRVSGLKGGLFQESRDY